jgi:hypothetical protein
MRIFIGSSANGEDAESEAVLEYTLRKNSSKDIDIVWMRQTHDPSSHWYGFNTHNWPTPFSGYRWAIPEYCNFKGKALYMDEDMINFKDISILYDMDMKGKPFAARRGNRFGGHEFCVTLIDCAGAEDFLLPVARQRMLDNYHQRCIAQFSGNDYLVEEIDPRWNCLDGEGRPIEDIWHLHWTKMATQPWVPAWFTGVPETHPRQDLVKLFEALKVEAAMNGYSPRIPNGPKVEYDIIGR